MALDCEGMTSKYIAVMGPNDRMKIDFINLLSGSTQRADTMSRRHGSILATPPFDLAGQSVVLLDTPEHDFLNANDIFKLIGDFLASRHTDRDVKLSGLVYIEKLDERAPNGGITVRHFAAVRRLTGEDSLRSFVVVSADWSQFPIQAARAYEEAIVRDDNSAGRALKKGGRALRHDGTLPSARRIGRYLLARTEEGREEALRWPREGREGIEYIAVVGVHGCGKETVRTSALVLRTSGTSRLIADHQFISLIAGPNTREAVIYGSVGEGSETPPIDVGGKRVVLIDTPGLDGSLDGKSDVYTSLAKTVARRYGPTQKLTGIIYIQRLFDLAPVGGIPLRGVQEIKNLLKEGNLGKLVIVTTGWETLGQDVRTGRERVDELFNLDFFFKAVMDEGAKTLGHNNTLKSAQDILGYILREKEEDERLQGSVLDILGEIWKRNELKKRIQDGSPLDEVNAVALAIFPWDAPLQDPPKLDSPAQAQRQDVGQPATIAVMGATGSGKSTFINMVAGSNFETSDGLKACTAVVSETNPFTVDDRPVVLIDTPGFDDTNKSDMDILKLIEGYLTSSYKQGHKLTGLLFFHRISDFRMGGVSVKNFRMFRKLCGEKGMKNVVIITNMWGEVGQEKGEERERELASQEDFFKPALDKGASMRRHDNTLKSAQEIIKHALKNNPVTLDIQEDTVVRGIDVSQTAAADEIMKELKAELEREKIEALRVKAEMAELALKREKARLQRQQEQAQRRKEELARLELETKREREQLERDKQELKEKMKKLEEDQAREAERQRLLFQEKVEAEWRLAAEKRKREKEEEERLEREYQEAVRRSRSDSPPCIIL